MAKEGIKTQTIVAPYVKKEGKILVEKGAAALQCKGIKEGTSTKVTKYGTPGGA